MNARALDDASTLSRSRPFLPFIVTGLAYLFIMQVGFCVLLLPMALRGRPDFRHLYTAGYMVRTGHAHELYDDDANREFQSALAGPIDTTLTFNHLAYEALLFAPFSFLSFRHAYAAFFAINLAMLTACFWMLRPHFSSLAKVWRWLPAAVFLCFFPITVALVQGQDSIALLTLLTAAFVAFERGQNLQGGIFVGLTFFKFQITLPILLLFLAWRCWRAVAGCAAMAAIAGSLSLWITGLAATRVYGRSLISLGSMLSTPARQQQYGIHPEAMPNLRGFFYTLASAHHISYIAAPWTTIVCSLVLFYFAVRSRPSFVLAVIVAVLVSYHGLIHDLAVLALPIGWISANCVDATWKSAKWTVGVATMIFALPTALMQAGGAYWLLALPVVALFIATSSRRGTELQFRGTPLGESLVTKMSEWTEGLCTMSNSFRIRRNCPGN
jgi:hypothetical protein